MSERIKVLVADDHGLIREGIAAIVQEEPDMEIVGQAASGEDAIRLFRELRPDVVIMDVKMPGLSGIDAMMHILRESPTARVIILTVQTGDAQAQRAIKAGAASYMLKSMVPRELRQVIRTVHAGRRHIPAEVATELAYSMSYEPLTVAEIDVVRLAAGGFSNKRIAASLQVSEDTVKSRMRQILEKLQASDRTHAVTLALRRGIIELSELGLHSKE